MKKLIALTLLFCGSVNRTIFGTTEKNLIKTVSIEQNCTTENSWKTCSRNRFCRKPFPQDFLFSGFIIEDDKIIANNEDTFTYCLNPENGKSYLETESSGTSGRMSYLNGNVYFVGGSTGKLHAISASTGEHVWEINASNLGESGSSSFKTNAVYVFDAENGNPTKVIALSNLNAYSFEAYQ
jgi:outer membrane protein assembly factor BamB